MKGYSNFIRIIDIAGDILLLNICFFLGHFYKFPDIPFTDHKEYHILFLAFNVFWFLSTYLFRTYKVYRVTKVVNIIGVITRNVLLHILLITSLIVALKLYSLSRLLLLTAYCSFFFTIIFWKISFTEIIRKYRKSGRNFRKVVLVGNGEIGNEFQKIVQEHLEYGYKLVGVFSANNTTQGVQPLEKLEEYVIKNKVDEVYCSLPDTSPEKVRSLIKFCDNNLLRIKFLPDFRGLLHKTIDIDFYDYMPVLVFRSEPLNDQLNKIIKRVFDILFSLSVIVFFLSWMMPIVAFLVKISSRGPILFRQKRSGENNKEFWCWKFRSMRINNDSDKVQASKNDNRITKIGTFLRKSNLDELPQFFNVLIGNMSVVGPRPHMLSHTKEYSELIDKYMVRHFVKPGITGLAQIKGYRGETKDPKMMENRIKIDIFYIENWSLVLDVKIVFFTVWNMIKGEKNAY